MMGRVHKGDCEGVARIPKRKVRENVFQESGAEGSGECHWPRRGQGKNEEVDTGFSYLDLNSDMVRAGLVNRSGQNKTAKGSGWRASQKHRLSYSSSSQKRREGRARVRTGVRGALKKRYESLEHKNSDGKKLTRCGAGRKERVGCRKTVTWKHTSPYAKQSVGTCYMMQGTQPETLYQPRGVGWGGDTAKPLADSCCCLAGTSTTL